MVHYYNNVYNLFNAHIAFSNRPAVYYLRRLLHVKPQLNEFVEASLPVGVQSESTCSEISTPSRMKRKHIDLVHMKMEQIQVLKDIESRKLAFHKETANVEAVFYKDTIRLKQERMKLDEKQFKVDTIQKILVNPTLTEEQRSKLTMDMIALL